MSVEVGLFGLISILLCHIVLITAIINLRYSLKRTILLWLVPLAVSVVILAISSFMLTIDQLYILGFSITVISFMLMYFLVSRDTIAKKCFLFFTQINFFFIIYFIGVISTRYWFNGAVFPGLLLRTAFYGLFNVVFILWIRPRYIHFANEVEQGWWQLALAAAIFTILLTGHCIFPRAIREHTATDTLLLVTVFVLMMLLYFVIFHTIYYMSKVARGRQIELQMRLMAEQIGAEQESVEASRRIRHDLRHHNLVIAEYARKQDIDGLLQYIDLYEADAEKRISRKICENKEVNYILLAYGKKAEQQGIRINIRAAVPKDLAVEGIHLTAILGNALENAIFGCKRSGVEKSYIDVLIQKKWKKLTIYIKNTCTEKVVFDRGRPISKTGGIGIRSLINAVHIYQGETDFSHKDECFSTRILLNLPDTQLSEE